MKTAKQFYQEKKNYSDEAMEGIDPQIIYILEEFANQSKWISVDERLPEVKILPQNDCNNSLPVLALLSNGEMYKMVLSHWFEDNPNVFSWVYSDCGDITDKVTHWQELPTAPIQSPPKNNEHE